MFTLQSAFRVRCLALVCLLAGTALMVGVWRAPLTAQAAGAAAESTREALAEYKRGNFESAIKKLEDILSARPDDAAARQIRDEITLELSMEFIENNLADASLHGRLRAVGQWMISGRTGASHIEKVWDDQKGIVRFVDEYMGEANYPVRAQRGGNIRDKYGEYAVPYIQEKYLHDPSADTRARARGLLATIGNQAVLPLIQIMQSVDPLDREYASHALGDIQSAIALPALYEFYERGDQPAPVKAACKNAIEQILFKDNPGVKDAKNLWFLQAEAYYRNEGAGGYTAAWNRLIGSTYPGHLPSLVDVHNRTYPVWRWTGKANEGKGGLFFEEVPMWNYADVLAEESCLNAMNLALAAAGSDKPEKNPFLMDCMGLLARISMRQYINGQSRLSNADAEERKFIQDTIGEFGVPRTKHMKGFAASMGPSVLFHAVGRELKSRVGDSRDDYYPFVIVGLCDALLELDDTRYFIPIEDDARRGRRGEESVVTYEYKPLVDALDHKDRRVRYAAARALVGLGRYDTFGANIGAQGVFSNSLKETATRTVLVIAEDDQIRTKYSAVLGSREYAVVAFDKLEEGLKQAQLTPVVDAIILEAKIAAKATFFWQPMPSGLGGDVPGREVDLPVNILIDDVRTRNTPLLLACPDAEVDAYKTRFAAQTGKTECFTDASYITFGTNVNISEDALENRLQSFFSRSSEARQFTTNAFIVDAASVLLRINPNGTSYDVDQFMNALNTSISYQSGRTSDAKVALARSIAHMAAYRKLDVGAARTQLAGLVSILNSESGVDTPAVKGAVAAAIGKLFLHHPELYTGSISDDAYHALKRTMRLQYNVTALGPNDEVLKQAILKDVEDARNAAGAALGQMPLAAQRRAEVLTEQRASRHVPLADQGNVQANRFGAAAPTE